MHRPLIELADVIRAATERLLDRHPTWLSWLHIKVLAAILRCRTAALGGHVDECSRCGHQAISYNSCRNRHCPRCQSKTRDGVNCWPLRTLTAFLRSHTNWRRWLCKTRK